MEDGLDRYAEPDDPRRPVVCCDERPSQLVADVQAPLPMEPGRPQRVDDAYEQQGCCDLLLIVHPLTGWRDVHVTERRTKGDVARHMTWLVDDVVPEAAGIRVALDNRNTHPPAVLYQTVPPAEARRLTRTLAVHAPPKHGSWLNMTAIACSILARQCLDRRLPDSASVRREGDAWAKARREVRATVQWRFTTAHARFTFRRVYHQ